MIDEGLWITDYWASRAADLCLYVFGLTGDALGGTVKQVWPCFHGCFSVAQEDTLKLRLGVPPGSIESLD